MQIYLVNTAEVLKEVLDPANDKVRLWRDNKVSNVSGLSIGFQVHSFPIMQGLWCKGQEVLFMAHSYGRYRQRLTLVVGIAFGSGSGHPMELSPCQRPIDFLLSYFVFHVERFVEQGLNGFHDSDDVFATKGSRSLHQGPSVDARALLCLVQFSAFVETFDFFQSVKGHKVSIH